MTFIVGYWSEAIQAPAHHARVGGSIVPHTIAIHTTDEHPRDHASQLKQWCEQPGEGTCAHFYIGRDASQGVVQMVPIVRNANHVGGPNGRHGWYVLADGTHIHPNSWAIGIELDGAGLLHKRADGVWIHPDSGLPIATADVYIDERGRGWHVITDYQFEQLAKLLDALMPELRPLPAGVAIKSDGDHKANGVPWAGGLGPQIALHATLDPDRKTDAGPQAAAWLRKRQASRAQ